MKYCGAYLPRTIDSFFTLRDKSCVRRAVGVTIRPLSGLNWKPY
jgi:hypothetical protein